ncbi:hypothetical protein [Streptobacillus notomytis]|uniref:hypothetical protein n=1 Tax=Streptobacillus notomytis TaxID=1712031 RepID=UPI000936DF12|nr:hypothetical protein [Streptobacillus notomytis]
MKIKEIIDRVINNQEITKNELFFYLRHIPNIRKTEEEFKIYCEMCKEKGVSEPNRNSKIRPIHEKNERVLFR